MSTFSVAAMGTARSSPTVGSAIPRNGGWHEPDPGDAATVEIMVGTNGVHTELVLPLVTREKDWRADFPAADVTLQRADYTHVAVSWGEKEVFLNTPTWGDLSPLTVLRIVGVGGEECHRVLVAHARLTCSCGGDAAGDGARSDRLSFIRISAASSLRPR